MKKTGLLLALLLTCAAVTGCSGKPKETEAPTEAPTEAVTEAATEAPTEPETETEKETEPPVEDSMNRTRTLNGLVKSSDTSSLTIQTERGKELSFSITGADIQVPGGITAGTTVKILYKGLIDETDTSGAKVHMVKGIDAGETPVTEGELMTEGEEIDENAGPGVLEGTVFDVNTERIVILANDGDKYYFSIYGTEMSLKNGTQSGNYVTVSYTGDIYGPELVEADKITDAQKPEDAVEQGAHEGDGYSYLSGTLIDCSTDTVTIVGDDEAEYVFTSGAAPCFYANGMQYGNFITVEYTGELADTDTSGAAVTAVYDYPDSYQGSEDGQDDGTGDSGEEYAEDGYSEEGWDDYAEEGQEEYADNVSEATQEEGAAE